LQIASQTEELLGIDSTAIIWGLGVSIAKSSKNGGLVGSFAVLQASGGGLQWAVAVILTVRKRQ